jgi:hypothetical protein
MCMKSSCVDVVWTYCFSIWYIRWGIISLCVIQCKICCFIPGNLYLNLEIQRNLLVLMLCEPTVLVFDISGGALYHCVSFNVNSFISRENYKSCVSIVINILHTTVWSTSINMKSKGNQHFNGHFVVILLLKWSQTNILYIVSR